jgi:glucose 1-dehydrogenase
MKIPHRLLDKTALVTGGSRGIGQAAAIRFAEEGATVAINHFDDGVMAQQTVTALNSASQREGHGLKRHVAIDADVSNVTAVTTLFSQSLRHMGHLDILVNNAGIQAATAGESFDEAVLQRILAVNLTGAALCARAAITHFLSRQGGAIINTTSVHEIVPKPGFLAYSIAKGGLGNLTRTLALEFADRNIRVNAVGPGAITTDMNAGWVNDEKARAAVERHIPMGRAASPQEIAPVFAFLASQDASYITGQTVFACGGITLFGDFKTNWAS